MTHFFLVVNQRLFWNLNYYILVFTSEHKSYRNWTHIGVKQYSYKQKLSYGSLKPNEKSKKTVEKMRHMIFAEGNQIFKLISHVLICSYLHILFCFVWRNGAETKCNITFNHYIIGHFYFITDTQYMTSNIWNMTSYFWHLPFDIWHWTCDVWHKISNISHLKWNVWNKIFEKLLLFLEIWYSMLSDIWHKPMTSGIWNFLNFLFLSYLFCVHSVCCICV